MPKITIRDILYAQKNCLTDLNFTIFRFTCSNCGYDGLTQTDKYLKDGGRYYTNEY